MLDEFCVRKPAGFPDHPHRGFETVTQYSIRFITQILIHQYSIHSEDIVMEIPGILQKKFFFYSNQ